jgi:hypothetical protein
VSRLTRFIQLTRVSHHLLEEFDTKHYRKITNATRAQPDVDPRISNLPIKKGGLGIPALLDIEQPALMSSYHKII